MFPKALEIRIKVVVLLSASLTTLAVNPWTNLDPINLPKLLVIGICGTAGIFLTIPYSRVVLERAGNLTTFSILAFFLSLLSAFVASDSTKWTQIYGQFGRNTGLLAFICLASLFLITSAISDRNFAQKLIGALIIVGSINAIYGFCQLLGMDMANLEKSYNPIVGTLGNPNFASALLGISSVASMALVLNGGKKPFLMGILILNVLFSLFVAYASDSIQGLIVFTICTTLLLLFRFKEAMSVFLWFLLLSIFLASLALGFLGLFNAGPIASLLFNQSVLARSFYWDAGLSMTIFNPFFGVGMDSFGDWYRFYRSEEAATALGPNLTSNSAHNVFLDISSNAGFPAFTIFCLIQVLVLRSCLILLWKKEQKSSLEFSLVFSYIAWLGQSLISVNQLGLAIWGWILGGAIIGYERVLTLSRLSKDLTKVRDDATRKKSNIILLSILGPILGLFFSIWPVLHDYNFRKALESGDGQRIMSVSRQFPKNSFYLTTSARILADNNYVENSYLLLKEAVELNPRDFEAWKMISLNSTFSLEERRNAVLRMKALDPFNDKIEFSK